MKLKILLSFIIFQSNLLWIVYGKENTQEVKKYGEHCSNNEECKTLPDTFLKCVDGVCGCDGNTMYISYKDLPYVMGCRKYFSNNITGLGLLNSRETCGNKVLCKNEVKCIPNEWLCDGAKECPSGEDEDPRLCSECLRGVWEVISTNPPKLPLDGRCVGLSSKPCNPEGECVIFADCYKGFCNCNTRTFYKSSTGTCGAGYGMSCWRTKDCGDKFICNEGRCSCPSNDQTFHAAQTKEKCLSLIHGSCDSDSDCISNAECKAFPHNPNKECQCRAGYVENQKRSCDLAHGASCYYKKECDQLAKLVCMDTKCSCPNLLSQYDPVERKCLGLSGAPCPDYPNSPKLCVENAACQSSHPDLQPICTCSPGFNSTENRFCVREETVNLT